ncbi:hypothetical protein ACFL3V_01835 [Nanoarchaeota archaeon]
MKLEIKKRIRNFLLDESGGLPIKKSSVLFAVVLSSGVVEAAYHCKINSPENYNSAAKRMGVSGTMCESWLNDAGDHQSCHPNHCNSEYGFRGTFDVGNVPGGFPTQFDEDDFDLLDKHVLLTDGYYKDIYCQTEAQHIDGCDDHLNREGHLNVTLPTHMNEINLQKSGESSIQATHAHALGWSPLVGYKCHMDDHHHGDCNHTNHLNS